ncbi:AAA family ATPase [Candidatus Shapirobacteria bacterium]|nr:AAA family ATPase [Candidatus Shapirobacteria bacterium]
MKKSELLDKELDQLSRLIAASTLPEELSLKAKGMVEQLRLSWEIGDFIDNLQRVKSYIDWIVHLPWAGETEDALDLVKAKEILDTHHYGLDEVKTRVLEYLSVLILQKQRGQGDFARAPILCFVGLVGTGKTTIASAIAEALNRKFIRIPFGGLGDPLYLRGQSRVHLEAEPGQVIKKIRQAGSKNPVILLDEIDRVADESLNTIMGVLVELLDPEQNSRFTDYYIDYPFDLSSVLFITTANNTRRIATAVLDRLEPIQMPSYSDAEKIVIAQKYLLPRALKEASFTEKELVIADECWSKIVRPLGYDAGVRTLKRTVEGVVRKVAKLIVEGKKKSVFVNLENIKEFLPSW